MSLIFVLRLEVFIPLVVNNLVHSICFAHISIYVVSHINTNFRHPWIMTICTVQYLSQFPSAI